MSLLPVTGLWRQDSTTPTARSRCRWCDHRRGLQRRRCQCLSWEYEICDGIDNDCNDEIDEGLVVDFMPMLMAMVLSDLTVESACESPEGFVHGGRL